jgi:hypothetical protein
MVEVFKSFLGLILSGYKQRKGFTCRFRSFPKGDPETEESPVAQK